LGGERGGPWESFNTYNKLVDNNLIFRFLKNERIIKNLICKKNKIKIETIMTFCQMENTKP
jgi:hypothetical protein